MMNKKSNKETPIEVWSRLIHTDIEADAVKKDFKEIYRSFRPYSAGVVVTGDCDHACSHCIYHPDFGKYNKDLSVKEWKAILQNIYDDLGIRLFVHNGRSFNDDGLEIIKYIKETLPGSKIGVIDSGHTLYPYLDQLKTLRPDWIDISIDGMEQAHDTQRNSPGAFKKTLQSILDISENRVSTRINVLTCLTSINIDSIMEMITFLNKRDIHNFFISPVSVLKNYRPSEDLKVDQGAFNDLVKNIAEKLPGLDNVLIEINLFDAETLDFVSQENKLLFDAVEWDYDHYSRRVSSGENEFAVSCYPLSLDGIRELIVNCNGDVLLPKVMAKEKLEAQDIVGSLLKDRPDKLMENLHNSHGFNFYLNHFFQEKANLYKGVI